VTGIQRTGWLPRPAAGAVCLGVLACLALWGCGDRKEPEGKAPRGNRPPVVTRVEIMPVQPRAGQELQVAAQVVDPDGDKVELAYQWEVNGRELEGEEESTLNTEGLRPGDRVAVRVTPFDGKAWGDPVLSQPKVISGAPPPRARVEISPDVALPGDKIRAAVVAEAPRVEDLRLYCRWKVNGEVVEEGPSVEFSTEGLHRGDRVQVEITMEGSGEESKPLVSRELVLQNRPPEIISQPPERLSAPGKYRYAVKAMDPDGDQLKFRLEGSVPPGMRIHPTTGLLEWDFKDTPKEPVKVDIRVSDGQGGEAQQSYDFVVSQGRGS
jgi:hypothetical protein